MKNGIFVFGISSFVLEILMFFVLCKLGKWWRQKNSSKTVKHGIRISLKQVMGSCLKLLERPKKFTSNPVAATSILINKRCNRLFPSSLVPLFQSESKCETILMTVFDLHENESACRSHFHMKCFALVLKQRHRRTRKWPIPNKAPREPSHVTISITKAITATGTSPNKSSNE